MDPSSAALHLLAAKYFQLASFVMYAYDLILTFGEEIERIWKRPISFLTILFLLNRYGTLMQFIIISVAFYDPRWKGEPCIRYVRFEGSSTIAIVAIGQLIMILRVYAIYEHSRKIVVFLMFLWTSQIIISAVGLSTSFVEPLPPGFVGCILASASTVLPLIWILPMVTDSFIFLLTLYRTKHNIGRLFASFTSREVSITDSAAALLLRDGIMYYSLIVLVNLLNVLIYFFSEKNIKGIGASFSQLLTCTLISRLVLNLRSLSSDGHATGASTTQFNRQREIIWARTLNDVTEDNGSFSLEIGHAMVEEVSLQPEGTTCHGIQGNSPHEM